MVETYEGLIEVHNDRNNEPDRCDRCVFLQCYFQGKPQCGMTTFSYYELLRRGMHPTCIKDSVYFKYKD